MFWYLPGVWVNPESRAGRFAPDPIQGRRPLGQMALAAGGAAGSSSRGEGGPSVAGRHRHGTRRHPARRLERCPVPRGGAMPVTTIDLMREFRPLYAPGRTPALVTVPEFLFLMIDGQGDPNASPEYEQAVAALYAVSYSVKFELKRARRGLDY